MNTRLRLTFRQTILLVFVATSLGLCIVFLFHHQSDSRMPEQAPNPSILSSNLMVSQSDQLIHQNTESRTDESFGIIVDQQSGQKVVVSSDRTTVTMKDKSGIAIWSVVVIGKPGTLKTVGGDEISSIQLVGGKIVVSMGGIVASLDKQTGKLTWEGSR